MMTDGFGSHTMDNMVGGEQAERRLGESMANAIIRCNVVMDNGEYV